MNLRKLTRTITQITRSQQFKASPEQFYISLSVLPVVEISAALD